MIRYVFLWIVSLGLVASCTSLSAKETPKPIETENDKVSPTFTVVSSVMNTPIATFTPSPVTPSTATPGLSPTVISSPVITPTLVRSFISPENVRDLIKVDQWGKGKVWQVAWSPDEQTLGIVTPLGVYLYDAETLAEIRFISTENRERGNLAFSPDGQSFAFGKSYPNSVVELWQIRTGELLQTFDGATGSLYTRIAFNPEGRLLALTAMDAIWLFDVNTEEIVNTFQLENPKWVERVAFSDDGKLLVSTDAGDNLIHIWDVSTGELLRDLQGQYRSITGLSFNINENDILAAGGYGGILAWNVNTGELILPPEIDTEIVWDVEFSPKDNILAAGGNYATMYLSAISTDQIILQFEDVNDVITLAFNPSGTHLVSGSTDGRVQIWDIESGQLVTSIADHPGRAVNLEFDPRGELVASVHANTIRLWDTMTNNLVTILTGDKVEVTDVAFSPDGNLLASSGVLETKLWNLQSNEPEHTLEGSSSVAFHPDHQKLALGTTDPLAPAGSIKLFDIDTAQPTLTFAGHTDQILSLAFNPDGTKLASSSFDDTVRLWDPETGSQLRLFDEEEGVTKIKQVLFSPDGEILAFGGPNGVLLWDMQQEQFLDELPSEPDVSRFTFSPDGQLLITNSEVWDLTNHQILHVFEQGDKAPTLSSAVAISPDGSVILIGDENGIIKVWGVKQ